MAIPASTREKVSVPFQFNPCLERHDAKTPSFFELYSNSLLHSKKRATVRKGEFSPRKFENPQGINAQRENFRWQRIRPRRRGSSLQSLARPDMPGYWRLESARVCKFSGCRQQMSSGEFGGCHADAGSATAAEPRSSDLTSLDRPFQNRRLNRGQSEVSEHAFGPDRFRTRIKAQLSIHAGPAKIGRSRKLRPAEEQASKSAL